MVGESGTLPGVHFPMAEAAGRVGATLYPNPAGPLGAGGPTRSSFPLPEAPLPLFPSGRGKHPPKGKTGLLEEGRKTSLDRLRPEGRRDFGTIVGPRRQHRDRTPDLIIKG